MIKQLPLAAIIFIGTLATLVLPASVLAGGATFNIKQYGAAGDGAHMDTAALQQAIDAAVNAGGGIVLFPAGRYLSASLDLKSHVTLQLDEGATLLGSPHKPDYRKANFYGLLLADNQQDIAVCGKGVIDGQGTLLAADTERLWKEKKLLDAKEGERPLIINFRHCTNVTVRDITLKDSACWVEEYRDCEHLTVENIKVRSLAALNNDGIDIDGCAHVVVRGCDIDSEDDGICLKSADQACDDVLVENCRVRSSCNALKFGTASAVGFKNITCRNLEIYDTYICAIALEIVDGGKMENVHVSHIKITDSNNAIFVRLGHRNVKKPVGIFHDVSLSDITAEIPNRPQEEMNKFPAISKHRNRPTLITASITGLPGTPIQDVTLQNVSIVYGGIGSTPQPGHLRLDSLAKVPECAARYPEGSMFGTLPAWGFYCRHVEGIRFQNIKLRLKKPDFRPSIVADDVQGLELNGFKDLSMSTAPVIVLNQTKGATFRNVKWSGRDREWIRETGGCNNIVQLAK